MKDELILAVDCHYDDPYDIAGVAGVVFDQWNAKAPLKKYSYVHKGLEPYESGQFYRRELPCLLPLIQQVLEDYSLNTIVVDGYIDLGKERPGLGRYLYKTLDNITVVGVAKNAFAGATAESIYRGKSKQALWVSNTSSTIDYCACIANMHGEYRFPTLLKLVDKLARQCVSEQ